MKMVGGWLSRCVAVLLSLAMVQTSQLPQLPLSIVNCIDVDLDEIEELRLQLQNNLTLDHLEDEAFGFNKADWLRLKMLEERLPSDSKLKSRLSKAFRILIFALYEAYGQVYSGTVPGNDQTSTQTVYIDKLPKQTFTPNNNKTYGGQGEGSSIEEVVVPPQVDVPPYSGTSSNEDESAGEEGSDAGVTEEGRSYEDETYSNNTTSSDRGYSEEESTHSSDDNSDDNDNSEEYEPDNNHPTIVNYDNSSTVRNDEPQTDIDDASDTVSTREPFIITVENIDDEASSSHPVTDNSVEGTTSDDNVTPQSHPTTFTQSVRPFEGPASDDGDSPDTIPDTTTSQIITEDTTSYTTYYNSPSSYLPSDGKVNEPEKSSSTQEDFSTGTTESFKMFSVIFNKPKEYSKETQEPNELTIFPPSGQFVEQPEYKNKGAKGNCVNVGNLKFGNDIYSGESILNKEVNRNLMFPVVDKEILTAVEDNSLWMYKIKTLKKESKKERKT